MIVLSWTAIAFLLGSLPLAFWLAQVVLRTDIRGLHGLDGNPGAGNAWRAGGWRIGLPAALLDYGKAAVPVALAHYAWGLDGWALVPVGLAPVVGHAFSPFLHGRGGKAVAATFGTWTGLTGIYAPLAFGVTCGVSWRIQRADGWTMAFGMLGLLVYLALSWSHPGLYVVWAGNAGVMMWKHRRDLRQPVRLRVPGHAPETPRPGD